MQTTSPINRLNISVIFRACVEIGYMITQTTSQKIQKLFMFLEDEKDIKFGPSITMTL